MTRLGGKEVSPVPQGSEQQARVGNRATIKEGLKNIVSVGEILVYQAITLPFGTRTSGQKPANTDKEELPAVHELTASEEIAWAFNRFQARKSEREQSSSTATSGATGESTGEKQK